ncbi:MAG: GtrA family protein [Runella sp.]
MAKKSTLFNLKDLIAYFLVAGTGVVVQFISGSFFRNFYGYSTSVSLGYLVSFVVGFILTKLFAFDARNTSKTRREMVKFGIVAIISWGITVGISALSLGIINALYPETVYELPFKSLSAKAREINVNEAVALLIAMGFSFMSNFILHKTFTFKSTGFYDRAKAALNLGKD